MLSSTHYINFVNITGAAKAIILAVFQYISFQKRPSAVTIALLWAKPSDGMSLDGAIGGRPCNTIAIGRQTDGHPKAILDKRNTR